MSERPLVPHFALPFRLATSSGVTTPAVVEQDSLEDVVGCVEAALRTEKGYRSELPTFGITELTFQQLPTDINRIVDEVLSHEERALLLLSESPGKLDALVDEIIVRIGLREETSV